jgi:hypothetical protein
VTKLYLTPRQKRLLLELYAEVEPGTKFYNLDHMDRETASRRIDWLLAKKRRKEWKQ